MTTDFDPHHFPQARGEPYIVLSVFLADRQTDRNDADQLDKEPAAYLQGEDGVYFGYLAIADDPNAVLVDQYVQSYPRRHRLNWEPIELVTPTDFAQPE